ncbi:MAG: hypothetical protein ABII82_06545 [Verrucomicrobiota bacterium]
MSTPVSDKIFLGAGGLLFAGACVWAFTQQGQLAKLDGDVDAPSSGPAYAPEPLPAANISEALPWPDATSLERGQDWVYDVFTPPVIYYNTETKQFTVTPPERPKVEVVEVVVEEPFGVSLVKVVQYPFPIQLVGYIGTGADARGNFLNELTGETIIGTTGKQIPALNMEIVKFSAEVVRETVDGQPVVYTVATARVRDLKSGKETDLSSTKRLVEADPSVVIQVAGEESTRELEAGATFTVGENTFVIDSIQTEPPAVTITKSGGTLTEPKTETLSVPAPAASAPAADMTDEAPSESAPALPEGIFPGF